MAKLKLGPIADDKPEASAAPVEAPAKPRQAPGLAERRREPTSRSTSST